jgi:sulfur-oxidizing protein SoxZ
MASIKLRPKARKGIVKLKALIKHPMETGLRKKKGKSVPANHIVKLTITNNGSVVVDADIGSSISKDPYFQFRFAGEKGDVIGLTYVDSLGKEGSNSVKSR